MDSTTLTPILGLIAILLAALLLSCGLFAAQQKRQRRHWEGEAGRLVSEATELHTRLAAAEAARVAAETRASMLETGLASLRQQHMEASAARETAERDLAVARAEMTAFQERMRDWETTKAQGVEAAKAASLAVAQELSTKLLADHKRENAEAELRVQKHTQALQGHVKSLTETVAGLNKQVADGAKTIDTVWRALTSPGGAGQFAEIGLENTLKSFGLERERDFVMQYSVDGGQDGGRLRPDAVVFLRGDALLVIDSKASKFFIDLAGAEDGERQAAAEAGMVQTMNQHLRALADRNYQGAIQDAHRRAGHSGPIRRILNVMYLPSETQLERLMQADPEFSRRAQRHQIIPTGPAGLAGLIGFAQAEINLGRQAENQERIVDAAQALLESIAVALGHADKAGRNLQTAAEAFKQFTASTNGRLLPRARVLNQLGVPAASRKLPRPLPSFEVVRHDAERMIEGDAEEVPALAAGLPPPAD